MIHISEARHAKQLRTFINCKIVHESNKANIFIKKSYKNENCGLFGGEEKNIKNIMEWKKVCIVSI